MSIAALKGIMINIKICYCGVYVMKKLQNILNLVDEYQYNAAICYQKTGGRIYGNLKLFYIVFFAYQTFFAFMLLLGLIFIATGEPSFLYYTITSMILYVAAFVLMFFKLNLISFILNIFATVFKAPALISMQIMNSGVVDINPAFYWQHLIPVVLLLFVSGWMCLISTKEKYLVSRDYKVVLDKLYNKFHTDDTTEEEWQQFIENYKPEE